MDIVKIKQNNFDQNDNQKQIEDLIKSAKTYKKFDDCKDVSDITNVSTIRGIVRRTFSQSILNLHDTLTYKGGSEFTKARDELRAFSKMDDAKKLVLYIGLINQNLDPKTMELFDKILNLNFESLDVSGCHFHDGPLTTKIFKVLNDLKSINLSASNLFVEDLALLIRHSPSLESIDISNNPLVFVNGFTNLFSKLENLNNLNLSNTDLKNHNVNSLKPARSLEKINLSYNPLTSKAFKSLKEGSPHLKEINFSYCGEISSTDLEDFFSTHTEVTRIECHGTSINDMGLKKIVSFCTNLEDLQMTQCSNLTGQTLNEIAKLSHLKNLAMGPLKNLTSEDIKLLAQNEKLNSLHLDLYDTLSDELVKSLTSLKNLTFLSLSHVAFNEKALVEMVSQCPALTIIELDSSDITNQTLEQLKLYVQVINNTH